MTEITNREELRELRARAIYEASIPPHERQDDAGPTYFGLDKVRRDRFRKLANATIRAEELAGLTVVPLKATEEMAQALCRSATDYTPKGINSRIGGIIAAGNLLRDE